MAYNKFKKLDDLYQKCAVSDLQSSWLPKGLPVFLPSPHLLENLSDAAHEALGTEKAKSEHIVAPVLKEIRRRNPDTFKSFSGYEFNVDSSLGLNGYCDFILSLAAHKTEIASPIFCLVEAKDDKIEKGYAQCGAEMYAAQLFNDRAGKPKKAVYGCVTNAFSWCFLKLEGKNLYIDNNYVPLTFTEPHRVLAVLQWILDVSLADKTNKQ